MSLLRLGCKSGHSVLLSLFLVFALMKQLPDGEAIYQETEGGFQSTSGKKLGPSVQQSARN